jgi:hypothetical protein
MEINKFWLRTLGILGILGGIVLLSGDLLFYFDPVNTDLKANMGSATDIRIIMSAITALFATWFYVLGVGQVYYAFKPSSTIVRNTVVITFAAILIAYGVIHGAYVAIATTAKLSVQNDIDMETATALASKTNNILRLFVYPFFAVLTVVFITQVWKKKTLYPRWIIAFFPIIPFLFRGLFNKFLTGGTWIIFVGGFFNLILILFFIASTIALWNTNNKNKN